MPRRTKNGEVSSSEKEEPRPRQVWSAYEAGAGHHPEIAHGACNVPIERLGTIEQRRITAVLTRLGWVRGKKEVGTRRQLWVKAG